MRLSDLENEPHLLDIYGTYKNNSLHITVFLNTYHLYDYLNRTHHNYSLLYESKWYENTRPCYHEAQHIHLEFSVPVVNENSLNTIHYATVRDNMFGVVYQNVQFCIKHEKIRTNLAVCAYIARMDPLNEIRSWVAFQFLQKVELVILYISEPYPELEESLHESIQKGVVELKNFQWPRRGLHGVIVHSNQQAQINMCFFTNRHRVKWMILCDIDEYVYSMAFPFNLQSAVNYYDQMGIVAFGVIE